MMANKQPEQHEQKPLAPVGGNTPSHNAVRGSNAYKSTIQPDHPTLRPKNNWVERKRSGSDVPIPPKLNLP
jgi:hypothetical protein